MAEKIDYSKGIYDAKQLGTPKLLILGAQHMFAMFGATVLVPLLTGLSVSTTLLCAGLGTLLFHFLCKGKVPAFLGSSFAYLGGFTIVTNGGANPENLPYACAAVALSGLVYVLFSALISAFGIRKMMKFFPPVVTGPIIIAIGLILAPSAINNCQSNWLLAFVQSTLRPLLLPTGSASPCIRIPWVCSLLTAARPSSALCSPSCPSRWQP